MMEHRSALTVDAVPTTADGYAERATAVEMLARLPKTARAAPLAGDKGYDTRAFVAEVRGLGFTPHVAQNTSRQRSARSHDQTRRARRARPQPADRQTDRGTLRLNQDDQVASASCATEADIAFGPGSVSPLPSTTSFTSPPSPPSSPDRPPPPDPEPTNNRSNDATGRGQPAPRPRQTPRRCLSASC